MSVSTVKGKNVPVRMWTKVEVVCDGAYACVADDAKGGSGGDGGAGGQGGAAGGS